MRRKLKDVSVVFMQLGLLFTVCLIAANIFETKEIMVGSVTLTGGLLIFPLTYVICRIVCEVWGFQRASLLIVIIPAIRQLKKFEGADAQEQDISYGIFDVFKRGEQ